MDSLVRFHPIDEQLFAHFLIGKATGAPLPPNPIKERDIYSQEPWEIFDAASDQTFYVFTTLRKNKSRVLRTAGSGTWKEQHSSKITNGDGELIGHRKSFKFKGGRGSSATNGHWIMYEFSICVETQCKYVLCKIKYHKKEKKSEEKAIVISDDTLVRFEDENQRAKRACLLDDYRDCIHVIHDSAAALPSPTVDQAQPATSQAVGSSVTYAEPLPTSTVAAATLHLDIDDPGFSNFSGDKSAHSFPPVATATMQQSSNATLNPLFTTAEAGAEPARRDIRYTGYSPAFGCNRDVDLLPAMATSAQVETGDTTYLAFDGDTYIDLLSTTAEQVDNGGWMDRSMDMEIAPVVYFNHLSCSNLFPNHSEGNTIAMLASMLGGPSNQTWDPTSLCQQRSVYELQEQDVPVTLGWADKL